MVCKDFPGFIVNRVLIPMINEAVFALEDGVASAEAIDLAMVEGTNHPVGPLALADRIGLDTVLAICEVLHLGSWRSQIPPLSLAASIRGGWLAREKERPRILYLRRAAGRECVLTLTLLSAYRRTCVMHERKSRFTSLSGFEIEPVYTADHLKGWSAEQDLGQPGAFPYTRGIYPTMYRSRLWTMRQFAGFGSADDTNKRFTYLLQQGQTGLSVAFDLPTLMGLDSDDPRARGEVGYCGVAISSLADMERLFDDIPLDQVTTSMTINGPAAVVVRHVSGGGGKARHSIRSVGRHHPERHPEGIHCAEGMALSAAHRACSLIVDTVAYCATNVPKWHPISISGYHIREAGSTAVQELAFTLYDGLTYVEAAVKAGLHVDTFAPQLSFFFNVHNDFFEEIAKFRAARRLWAREMTRRYHPKNPRSLQLRCHAQTAGCSLTAQQPMNNVVRTTLQALAAVFGGTQSLHTELDGRNTGSAHRGGREARAAEHSRSSPRKAKTVNASIHWAARISSSA